MAYDLTVARFDINKLSAERTVNRPTNVSLRNNILIKKVAEESVPAENQAGLKVNFVYTAAFDPDVGTIAIHSSVLALTSKETVDEILNFWKKDKKLDQEIIAPMIHFMLYKCNVQALYISDLLSMPPPFPMPNVNPPTEEVEKARKAQKEKKE